MEWTWSGEGRGRERRGVVSGGLRVTIKTSRIRRLARAVVGMVSAEVAGAGGGGRHDV